MAASAFGEYSLLGLSPSQVSAPFPSPRQFHSKFGGLKHFDTNFFGYVASCALFLFPDPRKGDGFPYFVCFPNPIPQLPQGNSLEI